MKEKLQNVNRYGILHIPTGLIIGNYNYDFYNCNESSIEVPQKELTYSTKEKAQAFLDLQTESGLERKKCTSTQQEKLVFENMSAYGVTFKDKMILSLRNISDWLSSYRTVVGRNNNSAEPFDWSPEQSITFISEKMKIIECVYIQPQNFFITCSLAEHKQNPEEFKKTYGYEMNIYNIYPKTEFEIIEISCPIVVKRPTQEQFRKLIHQMISDDKVPIKIKQQFLGFISQ